MAIFMLIISFCNLSMLLASITYLVCSVARAAIGT